MYRRTGRRLYCKSVLLGSVAVMSLSIGSTRVLAQQVVDYDLSNAIDELEDVVKRVEFDHARMQGVDMLGDWEKILSMDLCVSLAIVPNVYSGLTLAGAGESETTVDLSYFGKGEAKFNVNPTISGNVDINGYTKPNYFSCFNVAPWILARWYLNERGEYPPLETFTYAEYDAVVSPAAGGSSGDSAMSRLNTGGEPQGMAGLNTNALAFLDTAVRVVFGDNPQATQLQDLPIYKNLIEPVDGLRRNFEESIGLQVVNGTLEGLDTFSNAFNSVHSELADIGGPLFTEGDVLGTLSRVGGTIQDALPFDLGLGSASGEQAFNLVRGIERMTLEDMSPCILADSGSGAIDDLPLPGFFKSTLGSVCDGADYALEFLTGEIDLAGLESELASLGGFVDTLVGEDGLVHQIGISTEPLEEMNNHLSRLENRLNIHAPDGLGSELKEWFDRVTGLFD